MEYRMEFSPALQEQPCPNCRAVLMASVRAGRRIEELTCPYCGWQLSAEFGKSRIPEPKKRGI